MVIDRLVSCLMAYQPFLCHLTPHHLIVYSHNRTFVWGVLPLSTDPAVRAIHGYVCDPGFHALHIRQTECAL